MTTLRALCWLSEHLPGSSPTAIGYSTRVLGGPVRGATLAMPRLERLAYALGTYEPHVQRAMETHVRPGGVAYDVGAHIGYFTLVLSRLVGPSGKVVAFEADPHNGRFLEENATRNRARNVTIVHAAVSDSVGTVSFASFPTYSMVGHIARPDTASDAHIVEVASTSLDMFVYHNGQPPPNFVKIDVEGAEVSVIRGALRTIREHRPVLLIELRADQTWVAVREMLDSYRHAVLARGSPREPHGVAEVLFLP